VSGTAPLHGPALWWRLVVIGGLWGSSFPLLRIVAAEMSPFAIAAVRGGFAAVAVLAFLAATGQLRGGGPAVWRHALVLGTCNGWVPNLLTALALGHIEAAPAALIHAGTPLIVAVMAVPLLREERPRPRGVAGLALGLPRHRRHPRPGGAGGRRDALGRAADPALGRVLCRRHHLRPQGAAGGGGAARARAAGGLGRRGGDALPALRGGGRLCPARLGLRAAGAAWVLASAVPLTMFLALIARARATDAAMVGYLQPPFAAGLGAALLGEWPALPVLVGGAIVLAGVWLATSRR
jgi:drug/metabolite transporter (DMT)-like permease